jgi:hypothetical protein
METYYQVTYKTETGLEVTQRRDTVERGYYLYKNLLEDGEENIKLEEISNSGIALLRAKGEYKPVKKEQREINANKEQEVKPRPKSMFEMMFGISKEEYNECLVSWNRLTGDNVDLL